MYSPSCIEKCNIKHPVAFGISFNEENKENIIKEINTFSKSEQMKGNLINTIEIERELKLDEINDDFINKLYNLEPFGTDNPAPYFLTKNIIITSIDCKNFNTFFNFENVSDIFSFDDEIPSIKGVAFKRDYSYDFNIGDMVNIIYQISYNKTLFIKKIEIC